MAITINPACRWQHGTIFLTGWISTLLINKSFIMKPTSDKAAMRSLSHCMEKLTNNGFTANFSVAEEKLQHVESGHAYEAEQVEIVDFYRFEGVSDPEDNSILYAILTSDGRKGMLVDAYGAYSDPEVDQFIKKVECIQKKKAVGESASLTENRD
jgi:hypothetical protein